MSFTVDQYRDVMRQIETPVSVSDVQAVRARYLDSREAITAAEQAIHAAQGSRGANLEPLYLRLQQAREEALQAQEQFQRIGQYGASLEAKAFADQQRQAQELEAKKREAEQLKANELEKAAFKAEMRAIFLQAGDSLETFEERFNAPVHGLWAQHVQQRVDVRQREMGQAWRDRYLSMHL